MGTSQIQEEHRLKSVTLNILAGGRCQGLVQNENNIAEHDLAFRSFLRTWGRRTVKRLGKVLQIQQMRRRPRAVQKITTCEYSEDLFDLDRKLKARMYITYLSQQDEARRQRPSSSNSTNTVTHLIFQTEPC